MAISDNAVGGISGGVSDIFAGFGDLDKAQGADLEGQSYTEAAGLALEDKQFTETSTAIKQNQADRELFTSMGRTTAAGTGSGLDVSGSADDILRQSASEGATAKAVAGQQGLITEAGYRSSRTATISWHRLRTRRRARTRPQPLVHSSREVST